MEKKVPESIIDSIVQLLIPECLAQKLKHVNNALYESIFIAQI